MGDGHSGSCRLSDCLALAAQHSSLFFRKVEFRPTSVGESDTLQLLQLLQPLWDSQPDGGKAAAAAAALKARQAGGKRSRDKQVGGWRLRDLHVIWLSVWLACSFQDGARLASYSHGLWRLQVSDKQERCICMAMRSLASICRNATQELLAICTSGAYSFLH